MSLSNRFRNFSDLPAEDDQPRCWFCNRSEREIREDYLRHLNDPDNIHQDINIEDMITMSHRLQMPICASCYFQIRNNKILIDEVFQKSEDDVWEDEGET